MGSSVNSIQVSVPQSNDISSAESRQSSGTDEFQKLLTEKKSGQTEGLAVKEAPTKKKDQNDKQEGSSGEQDDLQPIPLQVPSDLNVAAASELAKLSLGISSATDNSQADGKELAGAQAVKMPDGAQLVPENPVGQVQTAAAAVTAQQDNAIQQPEQILASAASKAAEGTETDETDAAIPQVSASLPFNAKLQDKALAQTEGTADLTGTQDTAAELKATSEAGESKDTAEENPQGQSGEGLKKTQQTAGDVTDQPILDVKLHDTSDIQLKASVSDTSGQNQMQTVTQTVNSPDEIPQKLTEHLLDKMNVGEKELSIQLQPENLGKISIKISYEQSDTTVSILCSDKKTAELLAESAKDIGAILNTNLGGHTTVYVDKGSENYLNQNNGQQQNNQNWKNQEEQTGEQTAAGEEQDDSLNFIQQLRLGLFSGLQQTSS